MVALADEFKLTDEDRRAPVSSGKETILSNRVHWARTYLDKAGAIERTRRSHFKITERGLRLLSQYPERIDAKILRQFPEFVEFVTPRAKVREDEPADAAEAELPAKSNSYEIIDSALSEISAKLASDLLSRIYENSPTFFESLVVDLVVAMGYGGSRERVVQQIGKSGDEGIDGIVNEDVLGLDVVDIQAKRYKPDQTIGRKKIQQFSGALVGKAASKGVFIATCTFTKNALKYAERVPQKIILTEDRSN
jgi:restriction system protein